MVSEKRPTQKISNLRIHSIFTFLRREIIEIEKYNRKDNLKEINQIFLYLRTLARNGHFESYPTNKEQLIFHNSPNLNGEALNLSCREIISILRSNQNFQLGLYGAR